MSGTFTVKCRPSHVIGWEGIGPNCLLLINQSTGDLDPLQSVQREFEIQPKTKKTSLHCIAGTKFAHF